MTLTAGVFHPTLSLYSKHGLRWWMVSTVGGKAYRRLAGQVLDSTLEWPHLGMRHNQYGTSHCAPSSVSVLHTLQPTACKPLSCQSRPCTCHPLQDASLKANWSPFLLHPLNITGKTRRATSAWSILFSFSINLGSSMPSSSFIL